MGWACVRITSLSDTGHQRYPNRTTVDTMGIGIQIYPPIRYCVKSHNTRQRRTASQFVHYIAHHSEYTPSQGSVA